MQNESQAEPLDETAVNNNEGNYVADVLDDDATVQDSYVTSDATPPSGEELERVITRAITKLTVPRINEMVTRTVTVAPNTPYPIAFANPWRTNLKVETDSKNVSSADMFYASTSTGVQDPLSRFGFGYVIYDAAEFPYNGDLWVLSTAAEPATVYVAEFISAKGE